MTGHTVRISCPGRSYLVSRFPGRPPLHRSKLRTGRSGKNRAPSRRGGPPSSSTSPCLTDVRRRAPCATAGGPTLPLVLFPAGGLRTLPPAGLRCLSPSLFPAGGLRTLPAGPTLPLLGLPPGPPRGPPPGSPPGDTYTHTPDAACRRAYAAPPGPPPGSPPGDTYAHTPAPSRRVSWPGPFRGPALVREPLWMATLRMTYVGHPCRHLCEGAPQLESMGAAIHGEL